MRLLVSSQSVALVRMEPDAPHPDWATGEPLCSISRTANETSVICPTTSLPDELPGPVQGPFVAVVVDEVLEFTQVGILLALLKPLADAGIPVLTVSTYDTDWVLLDAASVPTAGAVWRAAGYEVIDAPVAVYPGRGDDE
ncbi:MAG: ACT domain-containing protein [Kineosporiaceae bacterium]|nr:ACT domain-containing protein [Kineosporiaceae bacterium]